MSAEVTVVLERSGRQSQAPGPGVHAVDYGAFLPRAARQLDDIADGLGVPTLSSFHWADPEMLQSLASELEGRARENVARKLATQREWHDVSEGRRTVAALVGSLSGENPPPLPVRGGVPAVLADLHALAALFAATEERFHLESL